MFPAMGLSTFSCSQVMPEAQLVSFQNQLTGDPLEFFELYTLEISQLTVAQKFLIGVSHKH